MLTDKQKRFVEEYLVDLNATQAAIRAGYSADTAYSIGHENLKKPEIVAAIAEAQAARADRTAITADRVLRHWFDIATADANELSEMRRVNCRHCWGEGHAYQWTEAEFENACRTAAKGEQAEPENIGGLGFDRTRPPHPDCTECMGEGHETDFFHDTRKLKGGARLLYAGIKRTKDGFELKTRDQDKAMENVARHLGMFVDKFEGKVAHAYSEISDEELASEVERLMAQQQQKVN
jgi:phage terminase small subunit